MNTLEPEAIDFSVLPSIQLKDRLQFPKCPGIYFARVREQILYIGISRNLRQRWMQHHRQDEFESYEDIKLYWIEVSDVNLLPIIEKALIEHFKPQLNNKRVKFKNLSSKKEDGSWQFKGKGVGAKYNQKPISVMYSTKASEIIKSLPNRSEYIRQAVMNQLKADGLL